MLRSFTPTTGCARHVQSLSFALLIGCHADDVKVVDGSPHALPQPAHTADAPVPVLAGAAGAAAPADTSVAGSAPSRSTGGGAGAPIAPPTSEQTSPGNVELRCVDGAPGQLPPGLALVATDIGEHTWTINDGTLIWLDTSDNTRWTLERKPLEGDAVHTPAGGVALAPNLISQVDTIAADGGDVFVRSSELVGPSERRVAMRQLPDRTLAESPGTGLGAIAVDHDAVYSLAAEADRITLYRTPRTAAATRALGTAPFGWAVGAQTRAHAAGLVALGDYVYTALSSSGRGQVYRAAKSGNEPLAPLGPELAAVAELTTDGTDLVLVLENELDDLGDVHKSARIVRMTDAGEVHEITSITAVGDSSGVADRGVAVSGGIVYWANNLQGGSWLGTLWSAPLDGTRAPTKELTTPENFLSTGLVAVDGVVYFAVYCRVDQGNQVSGRTHVLQLQR